MHLALERDLLGGGGALLLDAELLHAVRLRLRRDLRLLLPPPQRVLRVLLGLLDPLLLAACCCLREMLASSHAVRGGDGVITSP
jgi:hypothetical protein